LRAKAILVETKFAAQDEEEITQLLAVENPALMGANEKHIVVIIKSVFALQEVLLQVCTNSPISSSPSFLFFFVPKSLFHFLFLLPSRAFLFRKI